MIGAIQGKVWGTTQCLFQNDTVAVFMIRAKAGGFCSYHKHAMKHNVFFVISGQLKVDIKKSKTVTDETILTDGMSTTVQPNEKHRFEAVTDVVALEIYFVKFNGEDIIRYTSGGQCAAVTGSSIKLAGHNSRRRRHSG